MTAALIDAVHSLPPFAFGYTAVRTHRITTKEFR